MEGGKDGRKCEVRQKEKTRGGVRQAYTYLQLLDLLLVRGFLGPAKRGLSGHALAPSLLAWRTP